MLLQIFPYISTCLGTHTSASLPIFTRMCLTTCTPEHLHACKITHLPVHCTLTYLYACTSACLHIYAPLHLNTHIPVHPNSSNPHAWHFQVSLALFVYYSFLDHFIPMSLFSSMIHRTHSSFFHSDEVHLCNLHTNSCMHVHTHTYTYCC